MGLLILTDTTLPPGFSITPRLERVMHQAAFLAEREGPPHVGTDHVARALLEELEGPHVEVLRAVAPVATKRPAKMARGRRRQPA